MACSGRCVEQNGPCRMVCRDADGRCPNPCYPGCLDCVPSGHGAALGHFSFAGKQEQVAAPWPIRGTEGAGHTGYVGLLEELRALHKTKSGGYGTDDDPFGNFTAVAGLSGEPRYLYPVLRSIEKLTRVLSLHAQGRVSELEEELLDVASLNVCAAAMLREDTPVS